MENRRFPFTVRRPDVHSQHFGRDENYGHHTAFGTLHEAIRCAADALYHRDRQLLPSQGDEHRNRLQRGAEVAFRIKTKEQSNV